MRLSRAKAGSALPRDVWLIALARAVNQLGAFSLAFLTILLCRVLGASLPAAGLVAAMFGLATIPSRLLGARLVSRLGARRTILLGLLGCAAAQLGIATAPGLPAAAAWALLLGLAFELYEPPSQAMIAVAVPPGDRAAAYALLTTALAVGNTGAGLVAAAVGQSSLRWLFVVDAASCLACALIVDRWLPGGRADPDRADPARADLARADLARADPGPSTRADGGAARCQPSPWRDRSLLAMTAAGTVFALIYMLLLVALPLSLAAHGINPASSGLLMAVATATLVLVRPLLRTAAAARLPGPAAAGAGFCLMAAGMAGYAAGRSLPAMLAPTAAWSIGNLLLTGRAFAVVTSLAPDGGTARYLAVYGLSWGVATVAAPVLATQVISSLGPADLWLGCAALSAAMAVVQPWLLHRLERAPQRGVVSREPLREALAGADTGSG